MPLISPLVPPLFPLEKSLVIAEALSYTSRMLYLMPNHRCQSLNAGISQPLQL